MVPWAAEKDLMMAAHLEMIFNECSVDKSFLVVSVGILERVADEVVPGRQAVCFVLTTRGWLFCVCWSRGG